MIGDEIKMQKVFERYEKKYLITVGQKEALLGRIASQIVPDVYPTYTISNIYYDTDDYRLIRNSLEGPAYKEKLRMRSYGRVSANDTVFVELKKKYRGVVYKRRTDMPYAAACDFLRTGLVPDPQTQIRREIGYFLTQTYVTPKAAISYDREAFCGIRDPELRITFDTNIHFDDKVFSLECLPGGPDILSPGTCLMEIKFLGVLPFRLAHTLSEYGIYPQSFSKYGYCYKTFIAPVVFPQTVMIPQPIRTVVHQAV